MLDITGKHSKVHVGMPEEMKSSLAWKQRYVVVHQDGAFSDTVLRSSSWFDKCIERSNGDCCHGSSLETLLSSTTFNLTSDLDILTSFSHSYINRHDQRQPPCC